jgi:WD40 repeat protein
VLGPMQPVLKRMPGIGNTARARKCRAATTLAHSTHHKPTSHTSLAHVTTATTRWANTYLIQNNLLCILMCTFFNAYSIGTLYRGHDSSATVIPAYKLFINARSCVVNLLACALLQNDGEKRAEFTGHSRWVSAMDIHPEKDLVVTASEDCTLNVWTLPIAAHKVTAGHRACGMPHSNVPV